MNQDAQKVKQLKQNEIGASGTDIVSGVISGEEYAPRLRGKSALVQYDKMRRNDATVNAALDALKLPIMSADFVIDPASDSGADREVAEFIETNIKHIIDWDKFLFEALTFLDFGFSLFEMVFEPREVNGKDRIALKKLAYRKQTSIERWETDTGEPGVTQVVTGERYSIPEVRLVRFTNRQEGENYEGRSILRTAYKHWYIKDKLYRIDAVGHERQGLGVIEIITPKGATDADKKKVRKLVRQLRASDESYIEHPEGWVVQFMDMNATSMKDAEPSINHHDRQITKNVLAQFLEIGASGSSGTRSTSEDHSQLFELAQQIVANKIVYVLQNKVVRALVDLNYNNVEYPTLRVGKIGDDNVPVVSDAVSKFVVAGALHPAPEDENTVRRMIGWPERTDEDLEAVYAAKKPVATQDDTTKDDAVKDAVKAARVLTASITREVYGVTGEAA